MIARLGPSLRNLTKEEERIAYLKALLPKPDYARQPPSLEDFAQWAENPTTRFVATAFEAAAKAQREAWTEASWSGGKLDPIAHAELRARADAYMALLETPLERYIELIQKG